MEITVVFADLSSFTEMTGRLGAMATYSVVDEFLRLASTTLTRHGAFIDKYIGDAVMAFFNVPIKRRVSGAQGIPAALCGLSAQRQARSGAVHWRVAA